MATCEALASIVVHAMQLFEPTFINPQTIHTLQVVTGRARTKNQQESQQYCKSKEPATACHRSTETKTKRTEATTQDKKEPTNLQALQNDGPPYTRNHGSAIMPSAHPLEWGGRLGRAPDPARTHARSTLAKHARLAARHPTG
jgi:hypothetical protein